MTRNEQRVWLIERLLAENPDYRDIEIPADEQEQKNLLRALMNVRMPEPISGEFLKVQDEYLTAERELAGVVDVAALPAVVTNDKIALWRGDITTLKVDAIVNAANSALLGCFQPLHSCIDNIIHTKSGIELRLYCNKLMRKQGHEEPTGLAKITPGFNLPCEYVLHTVGPIISGNVSEKDRADLASCYRNCFNLAAEKGCQSIAFCCISTGLFHFPNQEAAEIAVATIKDCLKDNTAIQKVVFNVFKENDYEIYRELLGADSNRG